MQRSRFPFLFAFRTRPNIGTDKSAAESGATLQHMHSRYLPNSNLLYVEHHTEKQYHFLSLWYDPTSGGLEPWTSRTLSGRSSTTLQSRYNIQNILVHPIELLPAFFNQFSCFYESLQFLSVCCRISVTSLFACFWHVVKRYVDQIALKERFFLILIQGILCFCSLLHLRNK